MRLLEPLAARFESGPAAPPPTSPHPERQQRNDGVTRIAVHLSGVRQVRVAVRFES
jgi:hypothetical protein